jgi:hypothetical protein
MNYAKSSNQQNNQISKRIDTLKNEIKEKIAVNEGRILFGNAVKLLAAPIGKFK